MLVQRLSIIQTAMTHLLKQVFAEVARLPESEQDAFAALMLEELKSEERWNKAFASSQETLSNLAAEALQDYRAGISSPLDPDSL